MVSTGRSFANDDDDGWGTPSMPAVFPGDSLCLVFAYPVNTNKRITKTQHPTKTQYKQYKTQ
jgi:hypothetical protein